MLPPQKHTFETIWGHSAAVRLVPRLLGSGRMPHAILITGADGLGKRSLAFAMAKAILSAGRPPVGGAMSAPLARAKKKVPKAAEPEPDVDLFGEAIAPEPAPEEDLFGAVEPEPVIAAPPPPPATKPDAPLPKMTPLPPRGVKTVAGPRVFHGYDPRVLRMVEASYPLNKEGLADSGGGCLDLNIYEPLGGRRSIVVDQMRGLQEAATVPPMEGAFRVVLIFGADTITQEAGNCVLKLLEEPPGFLVLILVANSLARVLPTIKSRCANVPLYPLEREFLVRKLIEEERLEPTLAGVAAALSECRPGLALAAVRDKLLDRRREVFLARLQVDRYGSVAIPGAAARLATGAKLDETLWLLLSFVRDRLVRATVPDEPELLMHADALDLLDGAKAELAVLDEEADRLLAAGKFLAHPYVPNPRAVLEEALWSDPA